MNAADFPIFSNLDVVYAPHWMSKITMPVCKRQELEFHSSNGDYQFYMMAPSKYGLPYGAYPRLLIVYLATMAKITRRHKISLGSSQASFLQSLGRSSTGGKNGSVRALKQQSMSLFSTVMHYEEIHHQKWCWVHYPLSEEGVMLWDASSGRGAWQSEIILSQRFFQDIIERAFPVRRQTLIELSAKPTQLDIYFWLTSRADSLCRRTNISWEQLFRQFGNNIEKRYHFRYCFKRSFKAVLDVYPEVRFSFTSNGITLWPFPPDVPKTFRSCG